MQQKAIIIDVLTLSIDLLLKNTVHNINRCSSIHRLFGWKLYNNWWKVYEQVLCQTPSELHLVLG